VISMRRNKLGRRSEIQQPRPSPFVTIVDLLRTILVLRKSPNCLALSVQRNDRSFVTPGSRCRTSAALGIHFSGYKPNCLP
jgi:hypothetical protein